MEPMAGSSGNHLEVNVDDVSAAADWIQTSAQDFRDTVEKLMTDVGSLMEKWQGSAADTHQTAWDDWASAARNLSGALADDADALRAAAKTFDSVDSGSATQINSTVEGLNL